MKKTIFTGLLLMGITAILPAEELPLRGDKKTFRPTFWGLNSTKKIPFSHYKSIQKADGKYYLDIKGELGEMPMYLVNKTVPLEDGEFITFKVTAKGSGKMQLGYYFYHNTGMSCTKYGKNEDLTPQDKVYTFKAKVTMPKRQNAKPTKFARPVMIVRKGSTAQISKVEYDVTSE